MGLGGEANVSTFIIDFLDAPHTSELQDGSPEGANTLVIILCLSLHRGSTIPRSIGKRPGPI